MNMVVHLDPRREIGRRDPRIFGQFIEHFHRQIYSGIYDPDSPLSDGDGFRSDVIDAVGKISPGIVRWPGGCFVSAYHWINGVGAVRTPQYDKAWRVEESNRFGTDEFIQFCRKIGAEPYICTNAGSGTAEEMSDWVEYCNLRDQGRWAALRKANGYRDPHNVRIWSIGNENYGDWEIGAKEAGEWARLVRESAKMMKAVDPSIELSAASLTDIDWNLELLKKAGPMLDWISVHKYWDPCWEDNRLSSYERCMTYTLDIAPTIEKIEHVLGALGFLGRIRIAFDEWNLRAWYHPKTNPAVLDKIAARNDNDLNATYTMADAVFSACFLNETLRHCNTVKMANFAPMVNTRGAIFTHPGGIVLRPTYHIFRLYIGSMGDTVIDSFLERNSDFEVAGPGGAAGVPSLDVVATKSGTDEIQVSVVNRNPDEAFQIMLVPYGTSDFEHAELHRLAAPSKDSCNDIQTPDVVKIEKAELRLDGHRNLVIEAPAHSVNVAILRKRGARKI